MLRLYYVLLGIFYMEKSVENLLGKEDIFINNLLIIFLEYRNRCVLKNFIFMHATFPKLNFTSPITQ